MIDRSLPGWAFRSATASTASPCSSTEFCQASTSGRLRETTYLVTAFMYVVYGLPSVHPAQAVTKSCQVRRPNNISPGSRVPTPISRRATSSSYPGPQPPRVKPPRLSSSVRPGPCTTSSSVTLIVTVIERIEMLLWLQDRPVAIPSPLHERSPEKSTPATGRARSRCSKGSYGDAVQRRPSVEVRRAHQQASPRSVGRLPEVEGRALVIDALGEQPVRLAFGPVCQSASRPDPVDGCCDVVDAVGQPHLRPSTFRRQDAERRRNLIGAPRAGVAGGERHLQHGLVKLLGLVRVPRPHRHVRDVALAQPGGPPRWPEQYPPVPERVDDHRAAAVGLIGWLPLHQGAGAPGPLGTRVDVLDLQVEAVAEGRRGIGRAHGHVGPQVRGLG